MRLLEAKSAHVSDGIAEAERLRTIRDSLNGLRERLAREVPGNAIFFASYEGASRCEPAQRRA